LVWFRIMAPPPSVKIVFCPFTKSRSPLSLPFRDSSYSPLPFPCLGRSLDEPLVLSPRRSLLFCFFCQNPVFFFPGVSPFTRSPLFFTSLRNNFRSHLIGGPSIFPLIAAAGLFCVSTKIPQLVGLRCLFFFLPSPEGVPSHPSKFFCAKTFCFSRPPSVWLAIFFFVEDFLSCATTIFGVSPSLFCSELFSFVVFFGFCFLLVFPPFSLPP